MEGIASTPFRILLQFLKSSAAMNLCWLARPMAERDSTIKLEDFLSLDGSAPDVGIENMIRLRNMPSPGCL